ncbi:uncharacterized protein LOC127862301 [Dreissena polymorpha]|uniref:uncharacterized protein LOC127862301 n=1 Tax=Dreissena polymorpha TaxID=45954 RepID=UPI002263B978|nr:uncharacterized protein LOC127862301 [Dreissena polymorpha]
MGTQTEHFIVNKDLFSGYTIDTKKQSFTSAEEYDSHLEKALPRWQADGVRGLWAKISLEHSHLTPVFAKHGLDFHHAQPGYVMMTKWLPTDEPNSIPEYANQYLGCAGFTVNDKNQLLVIQEKRGPAAFGQHWKLPGGHADKNEMLGEAARREVLEETGIDTEFLGIICFRHMLNYRYGCSDFYYICLMRPVNAEQPIKKCEQEIAACKWMDVDEFIRDPNTTSANNFFAECYKRAFKDGILITPSDVASHDKKTNHSVYSVSSIEQLNKSM